MTEALRTAESRFANLPNFPFSPASIIFGDSNHA